MTIIAYFTPETTLPVATAVSAILGFGLLAFRVPVRVVGKGLRRASTWFRSKIGRSGL